jgi:hypothetical protein
LLSVLAASALFLTLAAVAAAQEAKDKAAPPKDKEDKAAPAKDKAEKAAPEAKDKAAEGPKQTPYYPLGLGAMWYYKIGENRYTLKVAKYEKIGDLTCARVEMTVGEDSKVASVEHIGVTAEGVVRAAFDDKSAVPPVLFLKLPPKKGEKWKVDSVVGKTDKVPGEKVSGEFVAGEEAKVAVPAGTYDCVTVSAQDFDANGMKLNFVYYFAKDYGMIKQVIEVAGQKVVIELEKYEAGKPQ